MITLVMYSSDNEELTMAEKISRRNLPIISDEKWIQEYYLELEKMKDAIDKKSVIDIMFYDITSSDRLKYIKELRKKYQSTLLMIIADETMSPIEYVNPYIRPTSLILRPTDCIEFLKKFKEIVEAYININDLIEEETLLFGIKGERVRIPINQIYYFEACNKRIVVSTENELYVGNGSLQELENRYNKQFFKCHRSYMVSRKKIDKISLSENMIYLKNGAVIPLSKKYKKMLREVEYNYEVCSYEQ